MAKEEIDLDEEGIRILQQVAQTQECNGIQDLQEHESEEVR